MTKIGFVGLGIMGKPMAKNLLKAGYELIVYDIVAQNMAELAEHGALRAADLAQITEFSDVIITMLPNGPEVKQVILGTDGLLATARKGTILVDMSSISPLVSQEVHAQCEMHGVKLLDCPVSGGEPKAIEGTLAIMAGGDPDTFAKVEPILLEMGSSAVLVGSIGSGNVTKLANQIIVALNISAMSEAMVLATKCGVDPQKVFEAIRGGLAGSTVLEAKMPKVLAGDFKPGFRIELHIKDLQNALDAAHAVGAPIPLTAEVMEIMQGLKVAGKAGNDHCGIIEHYENLSQITVRK